MGPLSKKMGIGIYIYVLFLTVPEIELFRCIVVSQHALRRVAKRIVVDGGIFENILMYNTTRS
jgi:hypothetical protein